MGSKMSFGRGSSDQSTISEFNSVMSQTPNSILDPSDCKQIPEDERRSEEDLSLSREEEMKATELSEAAPESHSPGHSQSDRLVNSEMEGRADAQLLKHTSPEVGTEAFSEQTPSSVSSSTAASHEHSAGGSRRRKRPLKNITMINEDPKSPDSADFDATSLKNHDDDDVPDPAEEPFFSNLSHNEMAGVQTVPDDHVQSKRGKGRPKKLEEGVVKSVVSKFVNVSSPVRALRRRGEQQPSSQDEKTESDVKVDPRESDDDFMESSDKLHFKDVKRRGAELSDSQVPAKVSRLDDTCSWEKGESTDEHNREENLESRQVSPEAAEEPEQQTEQDESAASQRNLQPSSKPSADPEVAPLNSPSSRNSASPSQREKIQPSNMSGNQESLSNSMLEAMDTEDLPEVKDEDIEMELDDLNPALQSKRRQNSRAQPEGQRTFFRRKKGAKRRRRINNVAVPRPDPVDSHEDIDAPQQEADTSTVDELGSSKFAPNVTAIKRGGKTLYKCGDCGQICKFLSQYVIHQRIHTGERPYKCTECGKGFSKNSNLNLHLKVHLKNKLYRKCPYCKIQLSATEYSAHVSMHAKLMEEVQENSRPERRSRVQVHDNSSIQQGPVPKEKREQKVCTYCGKTFPFQSALVRHVRVHTGEKPYKCDICGKAFGQAYFLRVHELTHWSVKRYTCTRCEKSFTHYSNAKNHNCIEMGGNNSQPVKRHRPSLTYTCHICKNVFNQLQEFNTHMKAHAGAQLYRCLECDKLFGGLSEYNAHRSQCKGDRNTSSSAVKEEETMELIQYAVPAARCLLDQTSASAQSETQKKRPQTARPSVLKKPFQSTVIPAHNLSHLVSKLNKLDNRSDPRKYLCPSCGRLFRHMGRLRAHMLTHARAQSYTCACCGKTLENWNKLWHHQRIHRQRRGRFTCPLCGRGFRFVEPYKQHMSEHPGYQWVQVRSKKVSLPYQCEQCSCSFKTLDLLFNHQLCHSSTQDMHKVSDFDLSMDDHASQSSRKVFSLSSNNHMAAPEHNHYPLTTSSKYPDPVTQGSPQTNTASFFHNHGVDSGKTIQPRESSHERTDENTLGKPVSPLRTVKRYRPHNTSTLNEGSSDALKCAVCGNTYSAISDLYQHYLQHARCQV